MPRGQQRLQGVPVPGWVQVRPTRHQPTHTGSSSPSISLPAPGPHLVQGEGRKGRPKVPCAPHPVCTAWLTPSSHLSHRAVPGEPRGDPQHVVRHQNRPETALLHHTRHQQLVGQRQPPHLDHCPETGKCGTSPHTQTLHRPLHPAVPQEKPQASHDPRGP